MEDARRCGILARRGLDETTREEYSRLITERIAASPQFQQAKTVMLYRSVRGEVCLDGLRGCGKRLVYPLCVNGTEMIALHPLEEDAWTEGSYGIPEPIPQRSPEVSPEEIDLVICPCTAFDEEGHRMGMGAGYYDRFLPQCSRAFIAAAAFECQKAELQPKPWDVPMQCVFTERTTYYAK